RSGAGRAGVTALDKTDRMDLQEWRKRLRVATSHAAGAEIVNVLTDRVPNECLQAAGTGLLVALPEGVPDATELAERCCAALRARGATGDEELACELEV